MSSIVSSYTHDFVGKIRSMRPSLRRLRLQCSQIVLTRPLISPIRHPLPQPFRAQSTIAEESRLPRLVQPSTLQSIIPRFLRERSSAPATKRSSNPANYFIWIYILIGSQAIRILSLKNDFRDYTRQADLKLAKLREVVGKLQRGEEVDVEKVLGTGDEIVEREWEEALRVIESEERIWQNNSKKKRQMEEREERKRLEASPVNKEQEASSAGDGTRPAMVPHAPGFY